MSRSFTDYTQSQAFARSIRWPLNTAQAEDGLVYESLRHPGGENVCVFRPMVVTRPIVQAAHYEYVWDRSGAFSYAPITLKSL